MKSVTRWALRGVVTSLLLFFALYHLADYPTTWFDEGSHLHVPKTLLLLGAYADSSSDGLRHFGPTLGVGPTVLLPIAAVFKIFGIGLVQARLVVVAYLLGAIYLFYRLARTLDGKKVAVLALAFLVSSRAVALFETGRQVLGEVPALCFLLAAFLVWFSAWDGQRGRLVLAGLLFGAAAITKYQMLIAIAPALALGLVLNYVYYRGALTRVFLWPAVLSVGVFGVWQVILVVYLGPQNSLQNFAALRAATAGAATVFALPLMKRALHELIDFKTFGGALAIALLYGLFVSLPKSRKAQQWGMLWLVALVNLSWYLFASIGWPRYAFPGLAIASLFLARFFVDLFEWLRTSPPRAAELQDRGQPWMRDSLLAVVGLWAALIVVPSLGMTALPIIKPPVNAPAAMAAFLTREVPATAVIEAWEPELGFLTDHHYHYPPTGTLNIAVRHIWSGGPSPQLLYHPLETAPPPPYVVVGSFARWVDVYPADVLQRDYRRVTAIGDYELYARQSAIAADTDAP